MKKIGYSLLFVAALAACSNDEKTMPDDEAGTVPVRLSAGVPVTSGVGTKAVIAGDATFTASVAGWEAAAGAVDYGAAPSWESTAANISATAQEEAITLNPSQVYAPDDDVKTHMKAWYPAGKVEAGKVTFENTDGTVDAMLAGEVVGSKWDNEGKVLEFTHETTQVKFVVKAGSGLDAGTLLKGITIVDAELPTGFDLEADAVTYAGKADLVVPGIDGSLVIGTTAAGDAAGEPVMIRPMAGNQLHLEVATSTNDLFEVVATIDDDPNFVAGKAYTITLTFVQSDVLLSATVTPWTEATGSGQVE